jgi:hypothetical protein
LSCSMWSFFIGKLLEISSFFTVKLKMFLNLNHHHIVSS